MAEGEACPLSARRGTGLFERTHLSDKIPMPGVAARFLVCTAMPQCSPHPSVRADRREGRLQLRSRCGLEKSAVPSVPPVYKHSPLILLRVMSPSTLLGPCVYRTACRMSGHALTVVRDTALALTHNANSSIFRSAKCGFYQPRISTCCHGSA
jgi:hypothetical protein